MGTSKKASDDLIQRIKSNPACLKKVKAKQLEILENTGKVVPTEELIYVLYGDMDGLSVEDIKVDTKTAKPEQPAKTTQGTDKISHFGLKATVVVLGIAIFLGAIILSGINATERYRLKTEYNEANSLQVSRLAYAITRYRTNNNGKLPYDADVLMKNYLDNDFSAPDGTPYSIKFETLTTGTMHLPITDHVMYILYNATCNGDTQAKYSEGKYDYAIMYHGYGGSTLCVDSQ